MYTQKLYYENNYIKNFKATVLDCKKGKKAYEVILDKTAFFPEGGGQKADCGFIGNASVLDVQEVNNEIIHYVDSLVEIGAEYDCRLNWQIRFQRMQEHSGEHIVSGIVHSLFGYDNVGFHMEDDYVTVDFNGELNRKELNLIEEKANEAIYSNYSIRCFFPTEDELKTLDYRSKLDLKENVRLVEIENTDLCACCAPHLNGTGEIGVIKLLDFMRHRGGVRVLIKSGKDALKDYENKYKSVYEISNLLSSKQDEISLSVERVLNELDSVRKDFYDFKIFVAENEKHNLTIINNCAFIVVNGFDSDMLREVVNFGMERNKLCIAFSGNDEKGYSYVAGSNNLNMQKIAKNINESLNGRGGGKGTMVQGRVSVPKVKITEFITNIELDGI